MKVKCCPTCNRPWAPDIQVGGQRRQGLLDYIIKHPEGVTTERLKGHVWADDADGGPDSRTIVAVMIRQINIKLEDQGEKIRVRGSGGPGSVYKAVYL